MYKSVPIKLVSTSSPVWPPIWALNIYTYYLLNNTQKIHYYYTLNTKWSPVSYNWDYMQFVLLPVAWLSPDREISTRKIPVSGLFCMVVKSAISTEVQTSQVVCLGSKNMPSNNFLCWLFPFIIEIMQWDLEGVYGFKLTSETQMILRRKEVMLWKLCYSGLHRKCHMRVNCRIEELGVWCLNQGLKPWMKFIQW